MVGGIVILLGRRARRETTDALARPVIEERTGVSEPGRGEQTKPPLDPGLTGRSLLIAVILTLLAGLWIRQSEIVALATQVSESVPAIPGLAALVLLLPLNALLKRIPRVVRPLSRAEILVIFCL